VPRTPGSLTRHHAVVDARQRLWNAMRIYKLFTVAEIAPVADASLANAKKYLRALARAGYLRLERPKRNGCVNGHAIWRLLRNSGPRRPHPLRDLTGVYDPNSDQLYPYSQGEPLEEAPDGDEGEMDARVA